MKVGDTVYTVNAKTNKVDTWKYAGKLLTKDEVLIQLITNNSQCFLPRRCVFEIYEDALAVANNQ